MAQEWYHLVRVLPQIGQMTCPLSSMSIQLLKNKASEELTKQHRTRPEWQPFEEADGCRRGLKVSDGRTVYIWIVTPCGVSDPACKGECRLPPEPVEMPKEGKGE